MRIFPSGRSFGFWRNPRAVAQSVWAVWEFLPRRHYCRRGRNPQTDWAKPLGFRQNPKITREDKLRPSHSGNFCHAANMSGDAEIPRLPIMAGRRFLDFAKTLKSCGQTNVGFPPRGIFRGLAKPTRSRPFSLRISATSTILSARQESPD